MRDTCWNVITGAPCSGKTSVIEALARMGHPIIPESARLFIEEELAKGRGIEEIRGDDLAFQNAILNRKRVVEEACPADAPAFLDRAIPDSIAYFQLSGLPIDRPLALSRDVRYRRIFFFERLPIKTDRARVEDDHTAALLDRLLREAYGMLGYPLIWVPVSSVMERAAFILSRI